MFSTSITPIHYKCWCCMIMKKTILERGCFNMLTLRIAFKKVRVDCGLPTGTSFTTMMVCIIAHRVWDADAPSGHIVRGVSGENNSTILGIASRKKSFFCTRNIPCANLIYCFQEKVRCSIPAVIFCSISEVWTIPVSYDVMCIQRNRASIFYMSN